MGAHWCCLSLASGHRRLGPRLRLRQEDENEEEPIKIVASLSNGRKSSHGRQVLLTQKTRI